MTTTLRRGIAALLAPLMGLALVMTGVVIVGIGSVAGAQSAYAATANLIGYRTWATELGTINPGGIYGQQVICIDSGDASPTVVTSPSQVSNPTVAYLLGKYLQTQDRDQGAALAYIVKKAMDSNPAKADAAMDELGWPAGISAQILALNNEAATYAGPYYLSMDNTQTGASTGTVSNIVITSASGTALAGYPITLTLAGGATWDASGSTTLSLTSGSSPLSAGWTGTVDGPVSVSGSSTGLPGDLVTVYPPQNTGYQRTVAWGGVSSVSGSDPTPVDVRLVSTPKGNTQVSNATPAVGDKVTDTFLAEGGKPGTTQPGTWARYDITGMASAQCTDTNKVDSGSFEVTFDDAGKATVPGLGGYTVTADGKVYTYVDVLAATIDNAATTEDCGLPTQTVKHPAPAAGGAASGAAAAGVAVIGGGLSRDHGSPSGLGAMLNLGAALAAGAAIAFARRHVQSVKG